MLAKDLLSDIIPAVKTSDSGIDALNMMELFKVSHLPIVNNKEFLGLISDKDIYDLNLADESIGNHNLSLIRPYVYSHQHFFEIIDLVTNMKLTLVPVLNEHSNEYIGVITLTELVHNFAKFTSVDQHGGIIVLELNQNDYFLSQITQIVEENDAKILSLYITSPAESTKLELTIKLNISDLSRIIQTFNRYNYNIKETFSHDDIQDSLFKNRYESFLNYLNI